MNIFNKSRYYVRRGMRGLYTWRLGVLLTLCIILGGTSQDILTYKTPLYLISLLFIGQTLTSQERKPLSALLRPPVILSGLFLALFVLYLIPMPPSMWSQFEGREIVLRGYELAGVVPSWLPLSLTPEKSWFSVFDFIPIIAIVLIMQLSTNEKEFESSTYAVVATALIGLVLGILQVTTQAPSLNLYRFFNQGFPVGFFSNVNHQACLLAMALTLALYLAFGRSNRSVNTKRVFAVSAAMMLVFGTLMMGSIAGYILLIISLIGSTFIINRGKGLNKFFIAGSLAVVIAISLDFMVFSGQLQGFISKFTVDSETSRLMIIKTTIMAQRDFGIWGTGPGSFLDIYRIYEGPNTLGRAFVNEAHNDYLQIWLEMGILGVLILLVGLVWLTRVVIRSLLAKPRHSKKILFYAIAAFIPIIHSIVDYPLRTIAISAVFIYIILLIDRMSVEME